MKTLSIDCKTLSSYLSVLIPIFSRNASVQISKCVKITERNDKMILRANNGHVDHEIEIEPGLIEKGFEAVIDGLILQKICNALPVQPITLESKEKQLFVSSNQGKSTLYNESVKDFLVDKNVNNGTEFEIESKELRRHIKNTVFAVNPAFSMQALQNILFELKNGVFKCVSTDGIILCASASNGQTEEGRFLLPPDMANILIKSIPEGETIKVEFDDRSAIFNYEGGKIGFALSVFTYPDWTVLIPDYKTSFKVDRNPLIGALKRCSIFATIQEFVNLTLSENNLNISIYNSELGNGNNEDLDIEYSGKEFEITFKPKPFIDILNSIEDEQVIIGVNDDETGMFYINTGNEQRLIMPFKKVF